MNGELQGKCKLNLPDSFSVHIIGAFEYAPKTICLLKLKFNYTVGATIFIYQFLICFSIIKPFGFIY